MNNQKVLLERKPFTKKLMAFGVGMIAMVGLMSTTVVGHADTIGGIRENTINKIFPDPAVAKKIGEKLQLTVNSSVSQGDLDRLTDLNLEKANIQNIDGVKYLRNLKSIKLSNNGRLKDISDLSRCENLESIEAKFTGITTLPKTSPKLKTFEANISNISSLENINWPNLETLTMPDNPLTNMEGLKNSKKLSEITLSETKLAGKLAPLSNNESLKKIWMYDCLLKTEDVKVLSTLKNVNYLDLIGNPDIKDYSELSKLNNLKDLGIYKSGVTNDILKTLLNVRSDRINIDENHITDLKTLNMLKTKYIQAYRQKVTVPGTRTTGEYTGEPQLVIKNPLITVDGKILMFERSLPGTVYSGGGDRTVTFNHYEGVPDCLVKYSNGKIGVYELNVIIDAVDKRPLKEVFPDPALAQKVASYLKVSVNDNVPQSELDKITDLHVENSNIQKITGVRYLRNLQFFYVSNNKKLEDISELSYCAKLEYLDADHCNISKIPESHSNVKNVGLQDNKIVTLERVNWPNVKKIWIPENNITSIAGLKNSKKLESFMISNSSLKGKLEPLANNDSLKKLWLMEASLKNQDLKIVSTLKNLSELMISGNPGITDYSELSKLTHLNNLSLHKNSITNDILKTMLDIRSDNINVYNNRITDLATLNKLKASKIEAAMQQAIITGRPMNNGKVVIKHPVISVDGSLLMFNQKYPDMSYQNGNLIWDGYKHPNLSLDFQNKKIEKYSLNVPVTITKNKPLKEMFPDPALAQKMADYLEITVDDATIDWSLDRITDVDLDGSNVKDLTGIKNLRNLKTINLSHNSWLKDISELSNCQKLESIEAMFTGITTLPKNSPNLKTFKGNISRISSLENINWPNLETLSLPANPLVNIEGLKNSKKLSDLSLSETKLGGKLAPLSNNESLKKIWLNECYLKTEDMKALGTLKNLSDLAIIGSPDITDYRELAKLNNLKDLAIYQSGITNEILKTLLGVKVSSRITLNDNYITDLTILNKLNANYIFAEKQNVTVDGIRNYNDDQLMIKNPITTLDGEILMFKEGHSGVNYSNSRVLFHHYSSYPSVPKCTFEYEKGHISRYTLNVNINVTDKKVLRDVFADPILAKKVADILHVRVDEPVSQSDLDKITDLNVENAGIQSIAGVKHLRNLKTINVNNNKKLEDISELSSCPNLTELSANSCNISKIPKSLPKAYHVELNQNKITDLKDINWPQVFLVSVTYNKLSSIEGLKNSKELLTFITNGTNLSGKLNPLSGNNNLINLWLYDSSLKTDDLKVISSLNSIRRLVITGSPEITDYQELSKMTKLMDLNIGSNEITNDILKTLLNVRTDQISLSGNHITDLKTLNMLPTKDITATHQKVTVKGTWDNRNRLVINNPVISIDGNVLMFDEKLPGTEYANGKVTFNHLTAIPKCTLKYKSEKIWGYDLNVTITE